MGNKINLVELLKNCQKGMELDCTLYDNCTFEGIEDVGYINILVNTPSGRIKLTKEGCFIRHDENAKCVIFPKGETTWEGFVPPCKFKDGDILATDLGCVFFLNIRLNTDKCYGCYAGIGSAGQFHICEPFANKECCGLATEEEKQKLFDAIKANGYNWNAETKALDKLVPNKFNVGNLKPFDKVLVRDYDEQFWTADFFVFHGKTLYPFMCVGHYTNQCIPYEGNEHLLGTTDDCDEYYKIWK